MRAAPEGVVMANEIDASGWSWFPHPDSYYNDVEKSIAVLDEGWARSALCLRTGGKWRFGHGCEHRARSLSQVKSSLEVWHGRFKAGNTLAILHAVQLCAEENMPLPTWLAGAFSKAFGGFLQPGGPHSLDAVFKSPTLPTNTPSKAAAAKQDWQLAGELWRDCWSEAIANEKITSIDALLDIVLAAKPWGVKKRKARKLVIKIDENQAEHMLMREKQPLARFLEKRCKA
jgi:hypothetical protein